MFIYLSVSAEWEAVKNSEPPKDVTSQPVSTESSAASNTQTETFTQQVTMMPVQVLKTAYQTLFDHLELLNFPVETVQCYIFTLQLNMFYMLYILSLFQLPVAQAVPSAVGLVPPTFPVNMGIPPPGYGPPPFIRPGFNASQPPPGT